MTIYRYVLMENGEEVSDEYETLDAAISDKEPGQEIGERHYEYTATYIVGPGG